MKMNRNELQKAAGYVAYMQMASYFNVNPECTNRNMEQKLHLLYKMMPQNKQYLAEDICDKYIRQQMLGEIPEEMLSMRTEVIFKQVCTKHDEVLILVIFSAWKYKVAFMGAFDPSNKLQFRHKVIKCAIESSSEEDGSQAAA